MELSGVWKIKEVLRFNDNYEREWVSAESVLADENVDASDKKMLLTKAVFDDDGFIKLMMPLPEDFPEEEMKEALESGELELFGDGMMIFEEYPYKTVDGRFMFDTGMKGTLLDEIINSWVEIKEIDGMLEFFTYHLVKE